MSKPAVTAVEETAAAAAPPELWGPPFTSPWGWIPPVQQPGFWNATRPDAWNGGWVQQLGSNPHPANAPSTTGSLLVGYRREVDLAPGTHNFLARLELGPVSLVRRNGGSADAYVFLQLTGPRFNDVDLRVAVTNSVMYLSIHAPITYAGRFLLRFGGYLYESYQGSQETYAEIINRRAEVIYYPPGLARTAKAVAAPRPLAAEVELPAMGDAVHFLTLQEAAATREILAPVLL